MFYINPYTQYEDGYDIVTKLNSGEYKCITKERLGKLLEYEAKALKIEKIMKNKQYYNGITSSP